MRINSILKLHKLFVALCLVCFSAGMAHAQDTSGPVAGETVDLISFQARTGQTLFQTMKQHSLAMLLLVDPNCDCTAVKDSLLALRERVEKTGIAYYVVMIPDGSDPQSYFRFADSLRLTVESFVWTNARSRPGSLTLMTKPVISKLRPRE